MRFARTRDLGGHLSKWGTEPAVSRYFWCLTRAGEGIAEIAAKVESMTVTWSTEPIEERSLRRRKMRDVVMRWTVRKMRMIM